MDSQELYVRLGRLIEAMPTIRGSAGDLQRTVIWLAKLHALLASEHRLVDSSRIVSITENVSSTDSTYRNWDYTAEVFSIAQRALASAELKAPAQASGTFINAGNTFDAMAAIGQVLGSAKRTARIIDPYMDQKALSDFALLCAASVTVELLADPAHVKPTLALAVQRWRQQYTQERPLVARLTAGSRVLHDRLIIVDAAEVWTLTQSLNAFAQRSPATLVRLEGDAVPLKIAAYDDFWTNGVAVA